MHGANMGHWEKKQDVASSADMWHEIVHWVGDEGNQLNVPKGN